jgi:methionyl-tRNA formyltransferase
VGVRSAFSRGCINVHPSYLPFNRGAYPNVWPLVERTPAGASIHGMDDGIDTGPVYARRRVRVAPWDTGKTLYAKTEEACVRLFADKWPAIRSGRLRPRPQPRRGTAHRTADVRRIDEIDLRRRYVAADLIDVLRARTFPPHAGAFFRAAGKRVYLRLELIPEPGGKR